MARTRTTKAVAQRIDLNYFKRTTPFKRAKLWLAVLAPAVALVWIGWHSFAGDARVYSSGPLSPAHAVLEKQCAACHLREADGFSSGAADSGCLACHDGPAHHPEMMTASNASKLACAECHAEHRGKENLTLVGARRCAECHGDLLAAGVASHFARNIHSFADGHPEFVALRAENGIAPRDPGTIKLNHALHMKAIRRGPTGPLVQLNCSDCHRPPLTTDTHWEYGDRNYAAAMVSYTAAESFEPGGTRGLPTKQPWSDRQLMAPVKFANACAACHSLEFDKRFEGGVPHDRPEAVRAFLLRKFEDYIAAHPAELREGQVPERNLAGRVASPRFRTVTAAQWVAERVAVAEELLWHKTCSQCHTVYATELGDVQAARWDRSATPAEMASRANSPTREEVAKLPRIEAAHAKLQWLPHARFDHDAHTGFSCTGCHSNVLKSTESADVLIPGIAVCQTCHTPGPGKVSSECSECHTYHDWSKRTEVKPVFTLPDLRGGS